MLFSQLVFLFFLAAVLLFLLVVRGNRARKLFLLAASYYFYAYWDWRFCSLLLISTLVDFWVGQGLKATADPRRRRALLMCSLVVNLGLLGFFKYFNFFIESLQVALAPLGWRLETLDIILPVGISFYTFQTLSYTIDVYRGRLKTCDDFWDFALFVSFFPQLVAGPIVRAADFLPQLESTRPLTRERFFLGSRQFIYGLVKKVLLADQLAQVSDFTFDNLGAFDGWTTWVGVLCYAGQIYCDFSGYTDMAIGCARALGYDLCPNFNHPYVATSVTEFWRRWHISLSTWLRDYLYIPLGGNRKGVRRTYVNLMVTMLLGGLWHGAAWTFLFWGGFHGVALVIDKRLRVFDRLASAGLPAKLLGWAYTMLVVTVAWVFFRAQSFGDAWTCVREMFDVVHFGEGVHWISTRAAICLPVIVVTHAISATRWKHLPELPADRWYTPAILFFLIWLVLLFRPEAFTPFVYFQF
ncbi:MAG: MBOAT family protein [Pirellulales bacterium]|nr:MBOAT family protein [Pirellulales bacterium]